MSSEVLSDLITDVFDNEGLLEYLKLLSLVKVVDFCTTFEILPSSVLSSSPSIQNDGSPSQETCDAIANGNPVSGQEDLLVQGYNILMDVMLDSETEEVSPLAMELEAKMQRFGMPVLAGCTKDSNWLILRLWWMASVRLILKGCAIAASPLCTPLAGALNLQLTSQTLSIPSFGLNLL